MHISITLGFNPIWIPVVLTILCVVGSIYNMFQDIMWGFLVWIPALFVIAIAWMLYGIFGK